VGDAKALPTRAPVADNNGYENNAEKVDNAQRAFHQLCRDKLKELLKILSYHRTELSVKHKIQKTGNRKEKKTAISHQP
jgi:hypothetical protein